MRGIIRVFTRTGEVVLRERGEAGVVAPRKGGELARAACEDDVAWWRRVGGDSAMAFAFARLAAIAAAMLVFLVAFGVTGGMIAAAASGLGHAFSSCFRATASKVPKITSPLSCQMASKIQKHLRAFSRTAGFASPNALLRHFSNNSKPPEFSIACLARTPLMSR